MSEVPLYGHLTNVSRTVFGYQLQGKKLGWVTGGSETLGRSRTTSLSLLSLFSHYLTLFSLSLSLTHTHLSSPSLLSLSSLSRALPLSSFSSEREIAVLPK